MNYDSKQFRDTAEFVEIECVNVKFNFLKNKIL